MNQLLIAVAVMVGVAVTVGLVYVFGQMTHALWIERLPGVSLCRGIASDSALVEKTYVTDRGRTRRRVVRIDLAQVRRDLDVPAPEDCEVRQRIQAQFADAVGETTFAIWLEPLELIAIGPDGEPVVAAQPQTVSWVRARFRRLMNRCAERAGKRVRLAEEPERLALGRDNEHAAPWRAVGEVDQKEVSG